MQYAQHPLTQFCDNNLGNQVSLTWKTCNGKPVHLTHPIKPQRTESHFIFSHSSNITQYITQVRLCSLKASSHHL